MESVICTDALVNARLSSSCAAATASASASYAPLPCVFLPLRRFSPPPLAPALARRLCVSGGRGAAARHRGPSAVAASNSTLMSNSVPPKNGLYTVGDFMTRKEYLHVVKPSTSIDEALERLVENRITGFPVIDDDWKLVGVVSDYDLLALDSISGGGRSDTSMFPEVDSSWKTFNEIQKLLSKTNGRVIADVMTYGPLVVRETTNLGDAARLLLETKYRRLPVVDGEGKLVGLITRGNVVRAALQIKRENEN